MIKLALVERRLNWDYGQGALADDVLLLILGPFGFSSGLTVESPFLAGLCLGFWGRWCWSLGLLAFLRPW